MRTVAIATINQHYLLTNYGSFFQHYALRKVLKRYGCRPFRVFSSKEAKPLVRRFLGRLIDPLRPLYWLLRRDPGWQTKTYLMKLHNRVNGLFRRDYLDLIGSINEKPLFDDSTMGIRGGDQVFCRDTPRRWLCAVKKGNPLITYAASTDWRRLSSDYDRQSALSGHLIRYTALGMRESEGVLFAKRLAPVGLDVQKVADPVQLLTCADFQAIQDRNAVFSRPTLFCYFVNIAQADDLRLAEYECLADTLGCALKIVGIQGTERFVPREYLVMLSPREFLRAVDDAHYFVTNSYHGSVFAMIYHKNFLSIRQNCPPGTDQNLRQKELMQSFALSERWVDWRLGSDKMNAIITSDIDWQLVDGRVDAFRRESIRWLEDVLSLPVQEEK